LFVGVGGGGGVVFGGGWGVFFFFFFFQGLGGKYRNSWFPSACPDPFLDHVRGYFPDVFLESFCFPPFSFRIRRRLIIFILVRSLIHDLTPSGVVSPSVKLGVKIEPGPFPFSLSAYPFSLEGFSLHDRLVFIDRLPAASSPLVRDGFVFRVSLLFLRHLFGFLVLLVSCCKGSSMDPKV